MIYLDNAAATPIDDKVLAVMEPYFSERFFNPSANYLPSKKVRQDLELARSNIAFWLGAKHSEITFTAGATEANNLAIRGILENFPGKHMLTTTIEHESVLEPAKLFKSQAASVGHDGLIDLNNLLKLVDDNTVLISVMYANNEIGTVQPLTQIANSVKDIRKQRLKKGNKLPLYFHTDAAQAANYLDLHVSRLGVDLMTINGGKIYGPKQTGFLYINSNVKIKPLIYGGGQEYGIRSGTENSPSIIGLAKALEIAQSTRLKESQRLSELQKMLIADLIKNQDDISINGSLKHRLPNNIHITIKDQDAERLTIKLESSDIYCATGSACSAAKGELSHVLSAIGLSNQDVKSSIRISMGRSTTSENIKVFSKTFKNLIT